MVFFVKILLVSILKHFSSFLNKLGCRSVLFLLPRGGGVTFGRNGCVVYNSATFLQKSDPFTLIELELELPYKLFIH